MRFDSFHCLIEYLVQAPPPVIKIPRVVNGLDVSDELLSHQANVDLAPDPASDAIENANHPLIFVDQVSIFAILVPLVEVRVV